MLSQNLNKIRTKNITIQYLSQKKVPRKIPSPKKRDQLPIPIGRRRPPKRPSVSFEAPKTQPARLRNSSPTKDGGRRMVPRSRGTVWQPQPADGWVGGSDGMGWVGLGLVKYHGFGVTGSLELHQIWRLGTKTSCI